MRYIISNFSALNDFSPMKLLSIVLLVLLSSFTMKAQTGKETSNSLRHVVLFKFTDKSTTQEILKVEAAFRTLPGKISLIKDFEWGINTSPENLSQGMTHCFFVTFATDSDRDAYLIHPEHQAFVKILTPYLDKVLV